MDKGTNMQLKPLQLYLSLVLIDFFFFGYMEDMYANKIRANAI